ncbi:MAG: hypothetical protein ACREK4_11915, partial [Candidatus Rokuibacteriota bacterium]
MAWPHHITSALALIATVALTATGPADAQVPTAADFAACNQEAPETVKAGTASPTTGDLARADNVRADITTSVGNKTTVIESSDPQIHGMSVEGARTAAYQAAYRS